MRRLTYEVAADLAGDRARPRKDDLYRQSDIPETFELFWLLCCATPKGMSPRSRVQSESDASKRERAKLARSRRRQTWGLYDYPGLDGRPRSSASA